MDKLDKLQELDVEVMHLAKNENGGVKTNSLVNVEEILEKDPTLIATFAFNDFTKEIDVLKDIPELTIEKGELKDDYAGMCRSFIEKKYQLLFSDKLFLVGLANTARRHHYNPLKDYYNEAEKEWDGVSRVESLLPDYLGVEKSPVTTLQTALFFVGAVKKVFEPKSQFDWVLDLVGGQGAGKTTFFKRMGRSYYTDQFTDFVDKDNYANMLRANLINDDEMTATNKSDFGTLKKFITADELEYRPPYGHHYERRPKSFVMGRTTNEITYLKDKTGERRFLPNMVNKKLQKKNPWEDLTPKIVKQLWGEFTHLYKAGFSFDLSIEQLEIIKKHREEFMYIDQTEQEIEETLAKWQEDFITSNDIANALGEDNLVKNPRMSSKIKYVMDNHDAWKIGSKKFDDKSKRGWRKL